MNAKKNELGTLSSEQLNVRYLNLLQILYLSALKDKHSNNYYVPSSVIKKIETELDFNSTEVTKKGIIEQYKKKYRKRKSYLMWSEILQKGNYSNYKDAKDVLIMIHDTQQYKYQSITQERYAMETLELALDDYFQTNKLKITPNHFIARNIKKPNVKAKKPNKQCRSKKALTANRPF